MKVLIACEFSGTVRDAFTKLGHDAISCDFIPSETPGKHYQGDVFDIINDGFDLMIAHPPCTYLSCSGMHRTVNGFRDPQLTVDALEFVRKLIDVSIPKICIENPRSIISTHIRKKDQSIQPYQFGHDASKDTWLWLKNLPKLIPTDYIEPRLVLSDNSKTYKRWSNQTDSGQNKLPPSKDRWKIRSKTYQGIANAMASQWGNL
jgi:site-specific DNA-cytosine methylase